MYNAVKNSTLYKLIPEIHVIGPPLVYHSNRLIQQQNSNNIKMYKKRTIEKMQQGVLCVYSLLLGSHLGIKIFALLKSGLA